MKLVLCYTIWSVVHGAETPNHSSVNWEPKHMPTIVKIRRTFKYRLYDNAEKNQLLHDRINISGIIHNHTLALHRRYYRLTGEYIPLGRLKKHIAKLRMKTEKFAYWKLVGSQSVQDILERLDKSFQRFLRKKVGYCASNQSESINPSRSKQRQVGNLAKIRTSAVVKSTRSSRGTSKLWAYGTSL